MARKKKPQTKKKGPKRSAAPRAVTRARPRFRLSPSQLAVAKLRYQHEIPWGPLCYIPVAGRTEPTQFITVKIRTTINVATNGYTIMLSPHNYLVNQLFTSPTVGGALTHTYPMWGYNMATATWAAFTAFDNQLLSDQAALDQACGAYRFIGGTIKWCNTNTALNQGGQTYVSNRGMQLSPGLPVVGGGLPMDLAAGTVGSIAPLEQRVHEYCIAPRACDVEFRNRPAYYTGQDYVDVNAQAGDTTELGFNIGISFRPAATSNIWFEVSMVYEHNIKLPATGSAGLPQRGPPVQVLPPNPFASAAGSFETARVHIDQQASGVANTAPTDQIKRTHSSFVKTIGNGLKEGGEFLLQGASSLIGGAVGAQLMKRGGGAGLGLLEGLSAIVV